MSNIIAAPSVAFPAELIAYYEASLALHRAQSAPTNVAPVAVVAPVKSDVVAPYGYKKDGITPRLRPVPTWLPNVKSDDKSEPVKSSKRKSSKSAPAIVAPVIAPATDWRDELARNGSTQHIRILAAELALFGAKSRKLTPVLTAKCATKGAASDHYQSLAKRVATKRLDIRNGSANWKLAAAIIAKINA